MGIKKFVLLTTLAIASAGTVAFASQSPQPVRYEVIKDATCMETGYERFYYSEAVPGATLDEEGYYEYDRIIPMLDYDNPASHLLGDWETTTEATCTQPGVETRTCTRGCGYTETRQIPASHNFKWFAEDDNPYVCGYEGKIVQKCTVCGVIGETKNVTGTLEHVWRTNAKTGDEIRYKDPEGKEEGEVKGTCSKKGYYYLICKNCGTASKKQETDFVRDNHNYGDIQPDVGGEPTCSKEGHGYRICFDCKQTTEVVIPKVPHTAVVSMKDEPTCTTKGKAYYKCSVCGQPINYEDGPAKGQPYYTVIPELGHKLTWVEMNDVDGNGHTLGYWIGVCTRPGCTYQKVKIDENSPIAKFTDVAASHWGVRAVDFVVRNKLMAGKTANRFDPDANITRAEFVQVLYNAASNPTASATSKFSDVQAGAWYEKPVNWAAASNLVAGYPNGTFGVSDDITREQLATILYKYALYMNLPLEDMDANQAMGQFTDVSQISNWAVTPMQWAVKQGIMSGTGDKRLAPQEPATRAQCASMIMNFMTKFTKVN